MNLNGTSTLGSLHIGFNAAGGSVVVGSGATLAVGDGATRTLYVGVTNVGTLDASASRSFTANVGNLYVGVNLGAVTSTGTLRLGVDNSITASGTIVFGGNVPDSDASANHAATVTTANSGTTTFLTPYMALGTSKGTGSFTLGSNAVLNVGSTGSRTLLILGRSDTGNGYDRPGKGIMNLSSGTANLFLSSLVLGRKTVGGATTSTTGTLTLGSGANRLDVSGTSGTLGVVQVAYSSVAGMGASGVLSLAGLDNASAITSTDNGTAVLVASGSLTNGTVTIGGGRLTITTSGTAIAGGGGTSALNIGGGATLRVGAASSNWIGGLTAGSITAGGVTIDTNGFDIGVSQGFGGVGGLTKSGAGTLTLTGVNSFAGGTTIASGTLRVGAGGFGGSLAGNVVNHTAIVFARADASTYPGVISGSGSFTHSGAGALTLGGANTYTGPTAIVSGTVITGIANAISGSSPLTIGSPSSRGFLKIDHGLSIANLTFTDQGGDIVNGSSGTAAFTSASGTATINVLAGSNYFHANAVLASPTVVDVAADAFFSFHNNLAGGGSLTKSGSGTMELTGDGDLLSGNLFITGGRVNIGPGMTQLGTGTTTLSNGAILDLNGQSFTNFIAVGNGAILNSGGTATTVVTGTATFSSGIPLMGTYSIRSTGDAWFGAVVGDGSSMVTVRINDGGGSGGYAYFQNAISGSANITVYAGGTADFQDSVGGYVISHGMSTFNGAVVAGAEIQVQTGGSALFAAGTGTSTTVSIASSAAAEFRDTVAGIVAVSGSARFTSTSGLTGSLATNAGGVVTLDDVAAVISGGIHADGTLNVLHSAGTRSITGPISGTGTIVTQGAGTLVIPAGNTFTGATTVLAGTLVVDGALPNTALDVTAGATLIGSGTIGGLTTIAGRHRPGNSPGIQTLTNLTYMGGSLIDWELWGNTIVNSPLAYDQISVTGSLTFTGSTTLNLVFTGSAGPSNLSSVTWGDPFWSTNREWLLFDVTDSTTGVAGNLSLNAANWQDSTGALFAASLPGSSFGIENRSGDVYILYTTALVPEPRAVLTALCGLAFILVGLARRYGR